MSDIENAISMVIDAGEQMQFAYDGYRNLSSDQKTKEEHKQALVSAVHKARRSADQVEVLAEQIK